MNYVHCAACRCAFDAAASRRCPKCGQKLGTGAGAVEDEVADAAAQLARALARATPAELDALVARITAEGSGPHAAPAAATSPERWASVVLGAVGGAVADERGLAIATIDAPGPLRAPEPPPGVRALVTALFVAVATPTRAALRRRATGVMRRVRAAFA